MTWIRRSGYDAPTTRRLVVAVASCGGGDGLRTALVGESAHFRLWVDHGFAERAAEAHNILAGLETSWLDTQTVLAMSGDGKLDYQLVTAGQLADACGDPRVAGCQIGRSIYSGAALDQHELNHAYMALRSDHRPPRFMMEEIAPAATPRTSTASPSPRAPRLPWRVISSCA